MNNDDCIKHGKTLDKLSGSEYLKKYFALLSVVMLLVCLITSSFGKINVLECSDDWPRLSGECVMLCFEVRARHLPGCDCSCACHKDKGE